MTRIRRAALGFFSDFGGHLLIIVTTFILTPIFLDLTSQALYGFWLVILTLLTYLGLVEFGMGAAVTREIAVASANKETENMERVFSTAFFSFVVMGLCVVGAGWLIAPYLPVWFKMTSEDASQVIRTFQWAIVASAISLPIGVFRGALVGLQYIMHMNLISTICRIIALACAVVLLYSGFGLPALGISHLIQFILIGCCSWYLLRKASSNLHLTATSFNKIVLRRLLIFGGYFQIGKIANAVAIGTDMLLIGLLIGAAAVTPYAMTARLPLLFTSAIASKLPISLFPAMSQMFGGKEIESLQQIILVLAQYSSRIAFVCGIIILVGNEKFINLWVGPEQFGGYWLNIIFVGMVLFDSILRGLGSVIHASGNLRSWAFASIIEAGLSVVLMLSLIPILGIIGAALGTAIARFCVMGIYLPSEVCRRTNLCIKYFIRHGIGLPLIRSTPGVILTLAYVFLVQGDDSWRWLIGLVLIACLSNIVAFEGLRFIRFSDQPFRKRLSASFELTRL